MQDGSPVGKKRTHRVRGASLSPRGRSEGEAGTADGTTEPDASSATTPEKAGEGPAAGVEEGAPDEDADSSAPLSPESVVSPRGLSRGDKAHKSASQGCMNRCMASDMSHASDML